MVDAADLVGFDIEDMSLKILIETKSFMLDTDLDLVAKIQHSRP